jgi:hypothetical protein
MKELELVFDDDPQQMENQFQMMRRFERDILFHDTVPLPEEQLPQARETAYHQKEMVLDFFRRRFSMSFTPVNVHEALESDGSLILLTSVRRSITDLTKEGRLIKCQWSESKPGAYGKLNRCWRYNSEFINRLNPTWNGILAEHPNPKFGTWYPKKGNSNMSRKMENL